jgi:TRAP-type mannitol/chloroaromatic compound transport system permease small subunit
MLATQLIQATAPLASMVAPPNDGYNSITTNIALVLFILLAIAVVIIMVILKVLATLTMSQRSSNSGGGFMAALWTGVVIAGVLYVVYIAAQGSGRA